MARKLQPHQLVIEAYCKGVGKEVPQGADWLRVSHTAKLMADEIKQGRYTMEDVENCACHLKEKNRSVSLLGVLYAIPGWKTAEKIKASHKSIWRPLGLPEHVVDLGNNKYHERRPEYRYDIVWEAVSETELIPHLVDKAEDHPTLIDRKSVVADTKERLGTLQRRVVEDDQGIRIGYFNKPRPRLRRYYWDEE